MIDWVTCLLPLKHKPINSGAVFKVDTHGQIEWETRCRLSIEGSYSSAISIKSEGVDSGEDGHCDYILFSGNPSKYLQGHNIIGSDDLLSLMYDCYIDIANKIGLSPSIDEARAVRNGDYPVKMIDINYSYAVGSPSNVDAIIRALEYKSNTRHGRPVMKGGTLYYGKTSRRWALKLYNKYTELQKKSRSLPLELQDSGLLEWVQDKVRIELRLLSKELKERRLAKASEITPQVIKQLFNEYLGKIDMSEQVKIKPEHLEKIPAKVMSTYILWEQGHDLRSILPKTTYYRHRKILKGYGVNIDYMPSEMELSGSNVVPFIRIVEAVPASIPDFAIEQGLIHRSAC